MGRLIVAGTLAFDHIGLGPRLADVNTTVLLTQHRVQPGGAAGNVAMALARLGASPTLLAGVGPDFEGSEYERALLDADVDLGRLVRAASPTARAFIFSNPDGDQATYFHAGASAHLTECDPVPAELGHFSAGEIHHYPVLMDACDEVTFDPGQEVFHRDLDAIRTCIPHVTHLFLNHYEYARLSRHWAWNLEDFFAAGLESVTVTEGAKGLTVHTPDESRHVPAAPCEQVVETTGAGDAHRAGFLYARSLGHGLVTCHRLGATVSSHVIEAPGAQETLPTLAGCEARYRATYGDWPF